MPGITASRTYYPGDLIYTEEAFVRVLRRSKKDEQCEFCSKSSKNLIPCTECSAVKYCGVECQAKDSSDHRLICAKMHVLEGEGPDNFIRMVARTIYKVKGKDWKTITRNIMGTEVSFDDIDSHYEEMTKNPRLVLLYKGIKGPLKDFIGEENMPEEDDLIKIVGKVKYSSCTFSSNTPDLFCFGMEKFDHECIPNANIEACNNVMKVWAIKKIEPSEKITVTHRNILTTSLMRSPVSNDSLEVCKCTECSLPYGESVLTKVIDERKAYTVIRLSENVLNMADVLSDLDLEKDFRLRHLVDDALQKHEGVLAPTNALHLKLLAIKAMMLEGTDIQKKMYLIELEKHMSTVYGEHYLELGRIYKALVIRCFELGNVAEAAHYLKKSKKVELHQPDESEETE